MTSTVLVVSDPVLAKRLAGVPVPSRVRLPAPAPFSAPTVVRGLRLVPTDGPAPPSPAGFLRWLLGELPREVKGAPSSSYASVARRLASVPHVEARHPHEDIDGDGARADLEYLAHYALEALTLPAEDVIAHVRVPGVTDEERAEIVARVAAEPDGIYPWDVVGSRLDAAHDHAQLEKEQAKERARLAEIEAVKPNTRTLGQMNIIGVALTKEQLEKTDWLDVTVRRDPDFFAPEKHEDGRFIFYFTDREAFGGLAMPNLIAPSFVPKSKVPSASTLTDWPLFAMLAGRGADTRTVASVELLDARSRAGRHAEECFRREARGMVDRMFSSGTSQRMRTGLERLLVQRAVRGYRLRPELVKPIYNDLAARFVRPARTETVDREIFVDDAGREHTEIEWLNGNPRPAAPRDAVWGSSGQLMTAFGMLVDNMPTLRRSTRKETKDVAGDPLPFSDERFVVFAREALSGKDAWISPGELMTAAPEEKPDDLADAFADDAWIRVLEYVATGKAHVTSGELEAAIVAANLSGPFATDDHKRLIRLMKSGRVDGIEWTKTQKRMGLTKKRIFVRGGVES